MFAHLLPSRETEVRSIAEDATQDAFVRVSALRALVSKGGCDEDYLLRLSEDSSPVVMTAVGALSVDYRYAAAPFILERMLSHASPAVRREAALRARGLNGGALRRSLRNSLHDRDPLVVSAVARALFDGKSQSAVQAERGTFSSPFSSCPKALAADATVGG
jgi:HEAT repeat protein